MDFPSAEGTICTYPPPARSAGDGSGVFTAILFRVRASRKACCTVAGAPSPNWQHGEITTKLAFALEIPPLRKRREDIPLLAEAFLQQIAVVRNEEQKVLTPEATELLQSYNWPGNVRELENAVERAVILATNGVISPTLLPERIRDQRAEPLVAERVASNPSLEAIERAYIMWVLGSEGGNKSRAAETLGIDPSTLYRKLTRFGVEA